MIDFINNKYKYISISIISLIFLGIMALIDFKILNLLKIEHASAITIIIFVMLLTILQLLFIIFIIIILWYITEYMQKKVKILKTKINKQKVLSNDIIIDEEVSEIKCCVCLEIINTGVKLACNHVLHKACLNEMFEFNLLKCPLCCQDIV